MIGEKGKRRRYGRLESALFRGVEKEGFEEEFADFGRVDVAGVVEGFDVDFFAAASVQVGGVGEEVAFAPGQMKQMRERR